jgi:peroxiredoxin
MTMAALDEILDRMAARGADRLDLRVGEIPVVVAQGRSVPVKKEPLNDAQWTALVRELAGAEHAAQIDRRQACEFAYRGFVFRVSFDSGTASCQARPEPAPATASEPPASSGLELDVEPREVRRPAPAPEAQPAPAPVAGPLPFGPTGAMAPKPAPFAAGQPAAQGDWLHAHRKRLVAGGVFAALFVAATLWWTRPVKIPNLTLKDAIGQPVTLADMRQQKDTLLLVFFLQNCPVSRFALSTIKNVYPERSKDVSFAGLLFGNQVEAERFRNESQVPFPVYGLKDAQDPFALQELIKKVGVSSMLVTGVYGGTIVVVDDQNRVRLRLEKEDVRKLPEKLAAVVDD